MKKNVWYSFLAGCATILVSVVPAAAIPPVGAGWVPLGSGARALGMGNAFTSIADDATAAWWNPAGLAQLERPELSVVVQNRTLETTDIADDGLGNTTYFSGSDTTTSLNFGSMVYPFGGTEQGGRTVISLSYGTFLDLNSEVTADNGYYNKTKGTVDILSFTAATEITPSLLFGIGYNMLTGSITDDFKSTGTFHATQDPGGDFVSVGILYRGKEFSVGAVYRADFQFEIKTTGTDNGMDFDTTNVLRYPSSGAVGLSYRPTENFTASFDVQYVNFSTFPMWPSEDVVHERIGLEYLVVTRGDTIIPLRAGYFMGNLGILDRDGASVDTAGFTAGTGIVFKDFQIDLSYERQSVDSFVQEFLGTSETNSMGRTTISRFLVSAIYRF